MDQKLVIQTAKKKNYPQDWRVYYGHGEYSPAFAWLVATIVTIWWWQTLEVGDSTSFLTQFLAVGPFIACLLGTILSYRVAWKKSKTLLVILPDSVVQCQAGNINALASLSFPTITTMSYARETITSKIEGDISSTSHNYWLDVYDTDGNYQKWPISNGFNQSIIAKNIIAAFEQYQQKVN